MRASCIGYHKLNLDQLGSLRQTHSTSETVLVNLYEPLRPYPSSCECGAHGSGPAAADGRAQSL